MTIELEKNYNPQETEPRIYAQWEKSGFFNPDNLPGNRTEPFIIALPPPNVTGILHMGSALMVAVEDTFIRFARMRGKRALWIPGTDSAAIATQARVEKDIQKKEGKNRHEIGREELLRRIDEFVENNKSAILNQLRAMGASLDWSRYAYTMDEKRYRAVMTAFVRMYEAGLIYRGNRIVNWDPKGQTTISDDEIVYEERVGKLYTFRYSKDFPIAIATTRPETKVGDTGIAVHPDDTRYQQYIGKEYDVEFCGVPLHIKVVADTAVDPTFGTGAVGITPAHSITDWDMAQRHQLPTVPVINEYSRMTVGDQRILDKKTTEAREVIIRWLTEANLLEKEEDVPQSIATAQRTGGVIEPLPKLQWFVNMNTTITNPSFPSQTGKTLKDIMREPVADGRITILPDYEQKKYFHWIDNLRDWCISRQIWFGHRIPIWYRGEELYCGTEAPTGTGWEQDSDVLDTWFSSALWTFSTLGWPDKTEDLATYHPTTLLETGYDILFFWVARMILMSELHLDQVPFRTVYLHGLVRDEKGRKISKSLGNNIDPVDMIAKYGTDAVRMALIVGTTPGTDSRISEDKIKAYKHFANKLWNIARFVLMSTDEKAFSSANVPHAMTDADRDILNHLEETIQTVTANLDSYNIHEPSSQIYHFIWHEFADNYVEASKLQLVDATTKENTQHILAYIMLTALKLLHPFMPFVTEEIYGKLPIKNKKLLMIESWPVAKND
jgi:valyl-tRNA synthetase